MSEQDQCNIDDHDVDWSEYESGPFCRPHGDDVRECNELCNECGHGCLDHIGGDECNYPGCTCEGFTE